MERYLPVLTQAVRDEELKKTPLKMLVARLYAEKFGYQVFGSQAGVDLADPQIRRDLGLERRAGKFGIVSCALRDRFDFIQALLVPLIGNDYRGSAAAVKLPGAQSA